MTDREIIDALRIALWHMVDKFQPFTLRIVGAPGSAARDEQDQQISAHRKAKEALALTSHQNKTGGQNTPQESL